MSGALPATRNWQTAADGLAARTSSLQVLLTTYPHAPFATVAPVCLGTCRLARRASLCVALVAAIIVGAGWVALGLASPKKSADQHDDALAALALRTEPGSPTGDARPGSHSPHRWHKRCHKLSKSVLVNDPSDDGTSRDSDDEDDDASDDLNCDDDTDGTIVACIPAIALYMIATATAPAPSLIEPHSPLFLTLQRFRC
jgi:hypothetical protein